MNDQKSWLILVVTIGLMVITLAACAGSATPAATTGSAATAIKTPTTEPTDAPQSAAVEESTPAAEPAAPDTAVPEPTRTETPPEPSPEPTLEPLPETTPEPLSKVEALLGSFATPPQATGDAVILYGQVLDTNGTPLPGVAVEIWQTDANGVYDHPGDRSTASRDRSFQFYGTSVSDGEGYYAFRTIRPGHYEPRPSHFHVKVRIDGQAVLTTQFYFSDEREALANEGLFAQAGDLGDLLVLDMSEAVDANGSPVQLANNNLVIDTGLGAGTLTPTPRQGEGPYYPVVTVADYDNDLTVVP